MAAARNNIFLTEQSSHKEGKGFPQVMDESCQVDAGIVIYVVCCRSSQNSTARRVCGITMVPPTIEAIFICKYGF
jgi:hypothetical protein